MTDAIILSIHQKHCRNILNGKKTLELRVTPNIPRDGCTAYLYATRPESTIVGRCKLSKHIATIDRNGNTTPAIPLKTVLSRLCLGSIEEVRHYLGDRQIGYLYPVSDPQYLPEKVTLADLGRNHPPMSYCCLNAAEISHLEEIETGA